MTAGEDEGTSTGSGVQRVTLATLTAMVVGGMVGAGVFSLPRRFATETGHLRRAHRLGASPAPAC